MVEMAVNRFKIYFICLLLIVCVKGEGCEGEERVRLERVKELEICV